MIKSLREACGVFGITGYPEASKLTYLGLYALQHRGQESAGIVARDEEALSSHIAMGLVSEIYNERILNSLRGTTAIGHVRYSTTGQSHLRNAQPICVTTHRGDLALAHNGNLVDGDIIRARLETEGSIFTGTTDTEVIVHLVAKSKKKTLEEQLIDALQKVKGAYSLLVLSKDKLIGVRDPLGFRPLCLGKLGDAWLLASESCAFDIIDAKYIRDVEPGEVVIIGNDLSLKSLYLPKSKTSNGKHIQQCIFEFIYFARPDSVVFNKKVFHIRKAFGRQLALEHPADADVVIPVPDSANLHALGYSAQSGIPFDLGLIRNHYVGRTFIEPAQSIRDFGVKIKHNPVRDVLEGKRVVVVEDSVVRGTTCRKIVKMLRHGGAKEVHLRVSSPPYGYPCYYGIDTPTRNELIAATHTLDEIRKYLRVNSLGYLSIDGLLKVMGEEAAEFCVACFRGDYPVKF
ncbi:MAG: amidophosphoribosyltransferase [bacterium]|nr:amidophosphoribosyltransferase [bacterium]